MRAAPDASCRPAELEADRVERIALLLGAEGLCRLREARVLVAGLGAVGSFAVEALARSAVGRLCLVDFDRIRPSNFNRQLLALTGALGRFKTDAARERVLLINPQCDVRVETIFLDEATAPALLADERPAVLIDAIDSVNPKTALLEAAVRAGVPAISCMGAALRMDPTRVRIDDLDATSHCPLAQLMRKRLRRRGICGGIRCVYSTERPRSGALGEADDHGEGAGANRGRPRRPLGSLCPVPGIFGLTAAQETLRLLLENKKQGEPE